MTKSKNTWMHHINVWLTLKNWRSANVSSTKSLLSATKRLRHKSLILVDDYDSFIFIHLLISSILIYYHHHHRVRWFGLFEWVRMKFFFAACVGVGVGVVIVLVWFTYDLMLKIELVIYNCYSYVWFWDELLTNPSRCFI